MTSTTVVQCSLCQHSRSAFYHITDVSWTAEHTALKLQAAYESQDCGTPHNPHSRRNWPIINKNHV